MYSGSLEGTGDILFSPNLSQEAHFWATPSPPSVGEGQWHQVK